MIVFSALCPHTPLLIPSVGKENLEKLEKTVQAYQSLEQFFFTANPDVVLLITPHGIIYPDAFSINLCDQYHGDFEEFGDYSTKLQFLCDFRLVHSIQDYMVRHNIAVSMDTCDKLDHGVTVPIFLLSTRKNDFKIVPMGFSGQDLKTQFNYGQSLKEILQNTNERVAVIASGDFSHRLSTDSPAGFSKYGPILDQGVHEAIKNKNTASLLNLDLTMISEAAECGLKPLLILLGILHGMEYDPEILSYESPFGVGYITCNFKLH